MPYLVKLADGTWMRRNKPVKRIDNATIYPHPSAAKVALTRYPDAKLLPFADVKDEWFAARQA
jgi:hypothetical protein